MPDHVIDLGSEVNLRQNAEGRFARLEAIEWWEQARVERARLLVVGAGALGNEILKNLALVGAGQVIVVDKDRVEASNLSRSVLFRASHEGRPKAECAAAGARDLYPCLRIMPIVGDVLSDVGLGLFRWADAVIGAVDNREARLFINSACARVNRVWFDGGVDVLHGIVRGFAPPGTSCYECTMSDVDWKLVDQTRSCSLLARRAHANRGTPTTPTAASVIAAFQVQEVLKYLHGLPSLLGRGVVVDGLSHSSYSVIYPIDPRCGWHEQPPPIEALPLSSDTTCLNVLWTEGERRLGTIDGLDLSREVVERLECPSCRRSDSIFRPMDSLASEDALCPDCETERVPSFLHTVHRESNVLGMTVRQLGVPPRDIVWARRGVDLLGLELAGDPLETFAAGGDSNEGT